MSTNTPIASQTLTSAVSSVTFTGIPQNYTDLIIISNVKYTSYSGSLALTFNTDTGSNYSTTYVYGQGSLAESGRQTNINNLLIGRANSTVYGIGRTNIQNYSNTNIYKTVLDKADLGGGSNPLTLANVGLWRNVSAITSLTLTALNNDTFASGSTFNLYGIAAGSPKAFGGNTVTTDGTYWYHTFTSSGTFTPAQALTADYLVVAGGGGGGQNFAGGGGAGGLRCTVGATGGGGSLESPLSLTAQAYAVTVGAGGAGSTNSSSPASSGNNSVFATITSTGGGGGGSSSLTAGLTGGSGGGASKDGTAGTGTTNQGYAGGTGSNINAGNGGGGAGSSGFANSGSSGVGALRNGGNGGNGVATSISGSSVTYAGGGGGGCGGGTTGVAGTGGTGGGGNGGLDDSPNPTAGTANTGGGGGGGGAFNVNMAGAAGGSGIVIVRYAV